MTGLRRILVMLALLLTAACGDTTSETASPAPSTSSTGAPTTTTTEPVIVVEYRLDRRVSDTATDDFESVVQATFDDPRGWSRAGFRLARDPSAEFVVVLAEGPEVDRLCVPYDTGSTFSCQNGPVVALNADRWRDAHPKWTGDVATYRQMLVNHEVGHLLGQHHPEVQCPQPGEPAPIMAQQSTELGGCLPNPWPLDHEIERAARHDLPLAPGYGE